MNNTKFFIFLFLVLAGLLPMVGPAYGSEIVVDTIQNGGRIGANINLVNYTGHLALASFWLHFNPDVVEYEGYDRTLDGYECIIMDDSVDSGLIKIVIQHVDPPLLSNPKLIRVNFKGADASAAEIDIKKVEMIKDFYGSTIYETKESISFDQAYTPSSQKLAEQKVSEERYANVSVGNDSKNSDEKNSNLGYDKTLEESTKMDNKDANKGIDTTGASEHTESTDKSKPSKPYGKVFLLCGLIVFLSYILIQKVRR